MAPAEPFVTDAPALRDRPAIVTFSGVDGAGKSTQICALQFQLRKAGARVRLLAFWDDVAACARTREFLSNALFKGQKGVGAPGKPVLRRDKNVRTWYMTVVRFVLYFLDALRLSAVVARISTHSDADVVIFDRYLYDELANLDLGKRLSRAYVRLLLRFVPRSDIAFVLDADPVLAHQRKPEYHLHFVSSNRASYLALSTLAVGFVVIPPLARDEVSRIVLQEISQRLPGTRLVLRNLLTNM